jgi:hypothetical protein
MALDTVRSLDEHYGREIDLVATRIHDRSRQKSTGDRYRAQHIHGLPQSMP